MFEGEYKNDKRNGKGKEYYPNGQLKFEGEYYCDYRKKGKSYVKERIEYEGEFLNGLKNGKGKEYNDDNEIIFEGEYLNGERKK